MTLNPNAVRVAGTGEVFFAPEATAAPTDASTALPAAWIGLGLTTPDGVQFQLSRDTTDVDAWQASKIRVISNAEPITLEVALLETKTASLVFSFGGGAVTGTAPNMTYTPPVEGDNAIRSMVVDFADGATKYRYYFPRVQVQGDTAFQLARTDALSYSITIGVLAATPTKWKLFTNDTLITTVPSVVVADDEGDDDVDALVPIDA